jgi:hypothetical protein
MITQSRRLIAIVLAVALILLVPLVAMLFTDEVKWGLFDFIVMGALLLGTGLTCEFIMRKVKKIEYRFLICGAVLLALL